MFKRIIKFSLGIIFTGAIIFGIGFGFLNKTEAATNLSGRILLQVQDKGQAWYVNPVNNERYYLGRPDDAYAIMRALGLGVSNADLNSYFSKVPARLAGRILLKVQDKGQAYYVDPLQLKLYYLGRPADAFAVMKSRGLGITNYDLSLIKIANLTISPISVSTPVYSASQARNFSFKYNNNSYELIQNLSETIYNSYKNSSKVYTYTGNSEPANLREVFYGMFLKIKSGDISLDEISAKFKNIAVQNNWNDDQLLEFVVSFIQYIPYDSSKVTANPGINSNPYFPYETLYLDKGVCSDKTFLAVAILRKLGYGAAILDFPDKNHTALGVACPIEYSINNSGYCYVETTNYFPLGVIPSIISSGQAQTANEFDNLFNAAGLGTIEMYQKTSGKTYQGMPALLARIDVLKNDKNNIELQKTEISSLNSNLTQEEADVTALKTRLDAYYNNGQIGEYNNLVSSYNSAVNKYNNDLSVYKTKVDAYNSLVNEYNSLFKEFYQQN
jgi:hypothetical protein